MTRFSVRSDDPTVSIVIPARNEAMNLRAILPLLPNVHEVIVVHGHSVDDTGAAALSARPGVTVIEQTRRGKGNALACGFAAATGDIVVTFDADGSADPAEIPRFVAALVTGADVAKGSRFAVGGGSEDLTRFRSWGNAGLNLIANLLLRRRYTDLCYGYNAFWRSILPSLELPPVSLPARADGRMYWGDGFEIETILACRITAAELSIIEVPSLERRRIHGESKLHAVRDGLRVLRTIVSERRARVGRAGLPPSRLTEPISFDSHRETAA